MLLDDETSLAWALAEAARFPVVTTLRWSSAGHVDVDRLVGDRRDGVTAGARNA